ncbi:NUP-domain-containing protein [Zopfia rhizophila CBS 207.26]|uniref:NUP-domain-containing protein n=1 Tax=Zopfia rhizophila CBS 207.26 TaxID=1314779 RepID=A0A6A6EPY5_9PEZI|nr:NUP-domain-containing protein [Zopfia rhizophila CBS 207.26]
MPYSLFKVCLSTLTALSALFFSLLLTATAALDAKGQFIQEQQTNDKLKTNVFILSTFSPEADVRREIPDLDLFKQTIFIPGLSPLFPDVHCIANGNIRQLTTGKGEINAAITANSLLVPPRFDFIGPTFSSLQELDTRDIPENFTTGYIPQSSKSPGDHGLRRQARPFVDRAYLNDSDNAVVYQSHFTTRAQIYHAAASPPEVVECNVVTADTWFSGSKFGEAIDAYVKLVTNGTGAYCTAAQKDNTILGALLRGAMAKLVDFDRVIIIRTGSDSDRQYWGQAIIENLNIYVAGIKVVNVKPTNYIGDIFGTLGRTPDFGPVFGKRVFAPCTPLDFGSFIGDRSLKIVREMGITIEAF